MDNMINNMLRLLSVYLTASLKAETTVSRLATGSGSTFQRLRIVDGSGKRKHRISTERAAKALAWFSDNWPDDLEWPAEIERPDPTAKSKDAA